MKIAMLTTYPPKECGIATYSLDLENSLRQKYGTSIEIIVFPLESKGSVHDYPKKVGLPLRTDSELDFLKVAHKIGSDRSIDIILVQHEFGLFRQNEPALVEFLEFSGLPVVVTLHTVLPGPDENLRKNVREICEHSDSLVVMTERSADILVEEYGLPGQKIDVIHHGIHPICGSDPVRLKRKYGLHGRTVLSTFGLLGPGKSIETTLEGLPVIIEKWPNVIFLVLGRTHPDLVRENGEDYRRFLEKRVRELGISRNVMFVDQFLPLEVLLEYLQLTDIYLFTSKDPNQAVSGTLAYALGCGCPVVSTPIPHAVEVLENGSGRIFDFGDSKGLARTVHNLLSDGSLRREMRLNGLRHAAASVWENAAIAHGDVFHRLCERERALNFKRPPIKLDHLRKMTSEIGVYQFCKLDRPDPDYGYTLDDNARALIALCRHYDLTRDPSDILAIRKYYSFIRNCFRPGGSFFNYLDSNCKFTGQNLKVNLEDAHGRAIWALGYLISKAHVLPREMEGMLYCADHIFTEGLNGKRFGSPRAMAFAIKGMYYYNLNRTSPRIADMMESYASELVGKFEKSSDREWQWFEPYLTYANSILSEALLMAFMFNGTQVYREVAKVSFDFLLSKILKGPRIQVVSNRDWLAKGQDFPNEYPGGEQPIDIAYTVLALSSFHREFPSAGYDKKLGYAFSWFLGNNALSQAVYNSCTHGCYDGLEKYNVNLNQGAESTICYLLARMALEQGD